jgi:hypothetical protein
MAAAAIQTFIISPKILAASSSYPSISILSMMGLAVGLNLCSEADAFVAASFRNIIPLSAQMAFMVLGPMLDIKLFIMYFGVFTRKAAVILAGTTLVVVFFLIMMFDRLTGLFQ